MKTAVLFLAAALATTSKLLSMDVPQLGALPVPLQADVPRGTVPNEGAPGFHTDDDAIGVEVQPVPSDGAKALEDEKKQLEALPFTAWIDSKKTGDGWVLTYQAPGMDMQGNVYQKYIFQVRRTIGGKAYSCYGGVKKREALDANVQICASLRAKAK